MSVALEYKRTRAGRSIYQKDHLAIQPGMFWENR